MGLQVLDPGTARMIEEVCDRIVPGSARVGPAVYIDRCLAGHLHADPHGYLG